MLFRSPSWYNVGFVPPWRRFVWWPAIGLPVFPFKRAAVLQNSDFPEGLINCHCIWPPHPEVSRVWSPPRLRFGCLLALVTFRLLGIHHAQSRSRHRLVVIKSPALWNCTLDKSHDCTPAPVVRFGARSLILWADSCEMAQRLWHPHVATWARRRREIGRAHV